MHTLQLWGSGSRCVLSEAALREQVAASQLEHLLCHQSTQTRESHTGAYGAGGPPLPSVGALWGGSKAQSKSSWTAPGGHEMKGSKAEVGEGVVVCGLINWWLWQAANYTCLWDPKIWTRRPVNGLVKPNLLELTWKCFVLDRFLQKIG